MGWFDGESSSDEEEAKQKKRAQSHPGALMDDKTTPTNAAAGGGNNEEDVDPLDAYMNSLASTTTATTSTNNNDNNSNNESNHNDNKISTIHKATRLDEENEEEATSHWMTTSSSKGTHPGDEEEEEEGHDEHDDEDEPSKLSSTSNTLASLTARSALSSTFRKADSKAISSSNNKASTNVDITLTPVKHDEIQYESIQKKLLSASSTTISGRQWRQEQNVTCSPPIDPIIRTWNDLTTTPIVQYDENGNDTTTSTTNVSKHVLLLLPHSFQRWCEKQSYIKLTPVQAQTISVALQGYDTIVTAATGSGKTLAYLWPVVLHLYHNNNTSMGLVLVPTRELAHQVESVANSLGRAVLELQHGQRASLAVTGGGGSSSGKKDSTANMGRYQLSQTLYQSNPRIVVATPGRLLDILRALPKKQQQQYNFTLENVTFVVLDEADKLLQMGFHNQVVQVLQQIRPDRQTIMTSATMGHKMEQIATQWMNTSSTTSSSYNNKNAGIGGKGRTTTSNTNLVRIAVGTTGRASEHVTQHILVLPNETAKEQLLIELLPSLVDVGRTLIFVATRDKCEQLATVLRERIVVHASNDTTIAIETLHGDKHQIDRTAALKAFKKGKVLVLIATDVAGRGLDIPQVATVINFDPAKNLDTHVHRIGRAGRLSNKNDDGGGGGKAMTGTAYTLLLSPAQADMARILRNALEREGRPISQELAKLANLPKHGMSTKEGTGNHRMKNQRWGLGFVAATTTTEGAMKMVSSKTTTHTTNNTSSSYYAPSPGINTTSTPTATQHPHYHHPTSLSLSGTSSYSGPPDSTTTTTRATSMTTPSTANYYGPAGSAISTGSGPTTFKNDHQQATLSNPSSSYYGPTTSSSSSQHSQPPPKKKSRWG